MSPQDMPEEVPLAPPSSLPPDVATPEVAAGTTHESDEETDKGLSPVTLPSAGPHPDLALPPAASTKRQLFGLLAAPIVWAAQQQAGYSLGTMYCVDRDRLLIHLVTLVSIGIALAGAWVAWRAWQAVGEAWPADEGGPPGRTRFVAAVGAISSVSFAIVIFAQGLPSFFFPICR